MERARSLLADVGHQLIDNGKAVRPADHPGVEEGVDFRAHIERLLPESDFTLQLPPVLALRLTSVPKSAS
jgi:hypothetical protein